MKDVVLICKILYRQEQATDGITGDSRKTQEFINDLLIGVEDMFKHIVALNTYRTFSCNERGQSTCNSGTTVGLTILSKDSH